MCVALIIPNAVLCKPVHSPLHLVYKADRNRGTPASKEEPESKQPAFIPVVGESEPELKPTGTTVEAHKRKLDFAQMATDDYHYDKYKKKARRF